MCVCVVFVPVYMVIFKRFMIAVFEWRLLDSAMNIFTSRRHTPVIVDAVLFTVLLFFLHQKCVFMWIWIVINVLLKNTNEWKKNIRGAPCEWQMLQCHLIYLLFLFYNMPLSCENRMRSELVVGRSYTRIQVDHASRNSIWRWQTRNCRACSPLDNDSINMNNARWRQNEAPAGSMHYWASSVMCFHWLVRCVRPIDVHWGPRKC